MTSQPQIGSAVSQGNPAGFAVDAAWLKRDFCCRKLDAIVWVEASLLQQNRNAGVHPLRCEPLILVQHQRGSHVQCGGPICVLPRRGSCRVRIGVVRQK